MKHSSSFLFVLLVFNANLLFSQLVNIESERMQTDSVRFAGNANLTFNFQKTNDVTLNVFKTGLSAQLKSKNLKNIFLVLGNYDVASSNKTSINNAGFGHLRYNYKINSWFRWEVYTQLQFNELLSLNYRYLAGTGGRFKLKHGDVIRMNFGISSFYEYEQIQDVQQTFNSDLRMSNYLTASINLPNHKGEITSTTYYQPLFRQFSDYRLTNQTHILLNLTKHFAFTTMMDYFFDFNPPNGVKQSTFSLNTGFRYTF